jgi:SNF2 family DNA or RNA helicase
MPIGKYGHTLTTTQTVIYHDRTWDADSYMQSMARVRRIGLDHSVRVITLKASGSTDELVEDNLAGKIPGIAEISNSDLAAMLRML